MPIDQVWARLVDTDNWDWNLWTRLETSEVKAGNKGKLQACYKGDDAKWETFDFTFGPVDKYGLTWIGSVGPRGILFYGVHTMRLEKIDETTTRLMHTEEFSGLLPKLGWGLPYKQLNENYLKMNNAFKTYVEAKA
eukprot:CAMPEP_0119004058 /NCGR_PEP_ID=MMETSP1176-20130426/927_1 /TAXON_ID=265551 /ORGANISM="Synedropsis recta cf, Strain CCMP1620" /LENGTH=135 /DNA_ID=CAMNT_0006955727 /DNA_START=189 /DNA_END=596 /DNA_ORIENTATION=+